MSSESDLKPVLLRAALISPGSTRALSRSVRAPVSWPLATKVDSANSIRAEVIGSIGLVGPREGLGPRRRALAGCLATVTRDSYACMTLW